MEPISAMSILQEEQPKELARETGIKQPVAKRATEPSRLLLLLEEA
jgi:hypothetical protein